MNARPEQTDALPLWQPAASRLEIRAKYALADLLRFEDVDFIQVAYQALLHRDADSLGSAGHLAALRSGSTSKIEILGAIRFSEEGRRCGVHVGGLLLPYKLHRLRHRRVVGPILGFAMGVARLGRMAMRLQSIEAKAAQESQHLGATLNGLAIAVQGRLDSIDKALPVAAERATAEAFVAFDRALVVSPAGSTRGGDGRITRASQRQVDVDDSRCKPGIDPVAFRNAMVDVQTRDAIVTPSAPVSYGARTASGRDASAAEVSRSVELCARDLNARIASISAEASQIRAAVEATIKEALSSKADAAKLKALGEALEGLKRSVDRRRELAARSRQFLEQAFLDSRRELSYLRGRIDQLTNRSDVPAIPESVVVGTTPEDAHRLDSFYVALEDQFRGSSELITKRCEVYVPVIETAMTRTRGGAVLDIGCGRGEWVRILQERGFEARGIDLNEVMVLECQAAGLDVHQAEVIAYLSGLEDGSIAAVTGMHIIEHIPFPSVVALFDAVWRVLKPGGVAVFETPNPENVDVGSCSFYMDPTHLHPLPPPLVEYAARARGFDEVEIRRLSDHRPVPLAPVLKGSGDPESEALQWLLDRSRERLSVAPDYAVLAWKERQGASSS